MRREPAPNAPLPSELNVQKRASFRAGWIGLLGGESLGSATARTIRELNEDDYRVAFIIPDRWSFIRHLLNIIVAVVTLGFVFHWPGVLIVGEKVD